MYLIILPAELSFPSSQRVCLDLRGVEKSIHVVLTLVHGSGNLSLYSKVVRNNWIFECSRFLVRTVLSRSLWLTPPRVLLWLMTTFAREMKKEDDGKREGMGRS